MGKSGLGMIVTGHAGTLRDAATGAVSRADWAFQFGGPLLLGVLAPAFGVRMANADSIMAAVAVLAGFTFVLLVFVFQLRVDLSRDDRPRPPSLGQLIDETFRNVAYAGLIGLITVLAAGGMATVHRVPSDASAADAAKSASPTPVQTAEPADLLGAVQTGLLLAFVAHFVIVLAMCTKRTVRAYDKLR